MSLHTVWPSWLCHWLSSSPTEHTSNALGYKITQPFIAQFSQHPLPSIAQSLTPQAMSTPVIMNFLVIPHRRMPHFLIPYAFHPPFILQEITFSTQLLSSHPELTQEAPMTGLVSFYVLMGSSSAFCILLSKYELSILYCLVYNQSCELFSEG